MNLWTFLAAAVGPLAIKVLTALGISVLTVTGVQAVAGELVAYVQSSWGTMPSAMAGLVGLSGLPTAVGMVLGAFNARLALWVATSASRWVVKGASS